MKLHIFHLKYIFIAAFLLIYSQNVSFSQPPKQLCVVLDAGHGGKDPGAVSGGVCEKDITLRTSLLVGEKLAQRMPELKIIYTRTTDRFVELTERTNIANNSNADLFVSIHTNASENSQATGLETFVMGVDKEGSNLSVAMRENGVISLENDYSQKYEGYDPSSSESLIIFSLMQYSFSRQSLELANSIQRHYSSAISNSRNRGVKQAGFLVLWRAAMPSVLTEIGFISNPTQRAYINSQAGQQSIADAISKAVVHYLTPLNVGTQSTARPTTQPTTRPIFRPDSRPDTRPTSQPSVELSPEPEVSAPRGVAGEGDKIIFRVQVSSSRRLIEINSANFGRYVSQITYLKIGELYKYYVGARDSYKEILLLQSQIRRDFADAFCVAMQGNEIISLEKAKKIKP